MTDSPSTDNQTYFIPLTRWQERWIQINTTVWTKNLHLKLFTFTALCGDLRIFHIRMKSCQFCTKQHYCYLHFHWHITGWSRKKHSLALHIFRASWHDIKHYTSHYSSMSSCSNANRCLVNLLTILCKINVKWPPQKWRHPCVYNDAIDCWRSTANKVEKQRASAKLCCMVEGMELHNFHRGRHLYSTGWPSRWALAHILVWFSFIACIILFLCCQVNP